MKRRQFLRSVPAAGLVVVGAACSSPSSAAVTTVDSIDVARYLGRWYDVASVKQFFSVGLVNITAEYSLRPDGNIQVRNTGFYGGPTGLKSQIVGSAFPVDASNARLNVSFTGSNTSNGPGNYWVVDIDPDYQWAIVSDPTGQSCFFLTRTPDLSDETYADLRARAAARGVNLTNLTRTPQNY